MFSRRKKSLSIILAVFVQIVPILCNWCSLFYLFPTTFKLFALPISFALFALNYISTWLSSSFRLVFFLCCPIWVVLCYVIVHCSVMLFYCSPLVFSGVRVSRFLVLSVCFVDRCLSFCTFSFGHCVVCPSNYGFWLSLWYLHCRQRAPIENAWSTSGIF